MSHGEEAGLVRARGEVDSFLEAGPEELFENVEVLFGDVVNVDDVCICLLYTSPSPRDLSTSRMPSSA